MVPSRAMPMLGSPAFANPVRNRSMRGPDADSRPCPPATNDTACGPLGGDAIDGAATAAATDTIATAPTRCHVLAMVTSFAVRGLSPADGGHVSARCGGRLDVGPERESDEGAVRPCDRRGC